MHKPDERLGSSHWSQAAALYKRTAEPLTRPFAEAALLHLPPLAGLRLLDVAAGTGVLATAAAKAGAKVLAADFAAEMVAHAQEALQSYPGCAAQVMDGQALDLPDASFDISASMFGVMMFPDFRRGLSELVRVTRPAGHVAVGVWVNPHGAGPNLLILEALKDHLPDFTPPEPLASMAILCTPDGLRTELLAAGCATAEVHRLEGAWSAEGLDAALTQVQELLGRCPVPLYQGLSQDARDIVIEGLRDKFDHFVQPDGRVRVPAAANLCVGRR